MISRLCPSPGAAAREGVQRVRATVASASAPWPCACAAARQRRAALQNGGARPVRAAAADGDAAGAGVDGREAQPPPKQLISLDTGGQIEQLTLPLASPDNEILQFDLAFPLGLVFESDAASGRILVAEVEPAGAAAAAGVRRGDALRALSAAAMRMTYPTAQLMFGGVGRPKLLRALVPATSFPAAMDAVRSNKQLGEGITLFLERPGEQQQQQRDGGGGSGGGDAAASQAAAGDGAAAGPEAVFDSSLFDE